MKQTPVWHGLTLPPLTTNVTCPRLLTDAEERGGKGFECFCGMQVLEGRTSNCGPIASIYIGKPLSLQEDQFLQLGPVTNHDEDAPDVL